MTGSTVSPGLFESIALLGRVEALARIGGAGAVDELSKDDLVDGRKPVGPGAQCHRRLMSQRRQMGIAVLVPDVNVSMSDFVAVAGDGSDGVGGNGSIPFGLSAVRNVGEGLVSLILAEREANGPFLDFYDFCDRVDTGVLNKRTIESLIKAGAFDAIQQNRASLVASIDRAFDFANATEANSAQVDIFGSTGSFVTTTYTNVLGAHVDAYSLRAQQTVEGLKHATLPLFEMLSPYR